MMKIINLFILVIVSALCNINCSDNFNADKIIDEAQKLNKSSRKSDLEKSIKKYDTVINKLSKSIEGKFGAERRLAVIFMNHEDWDLAITHFNTALKIKPLDFWLNYFIGACYANKARIDNKMNNKAIFYYKQALKIKKNDVNTLYALSILYYFNLKNKDLGLRTLKKAIDNGSKVPKHHAVLGRYYYDKGSPYNALSEYENAVELSSLKTEKAVYLKQIGIIYKKMNKFNESRSALQKAYNFNPGDVEVKRMLGIQ